MLNKTSGVISELGNFIDEVIFTWDIIGKCNYNCTYCYNKIQNKLNIIGDYKLTIIRLNTMTAPFSVEVVGGEPTLHPNILKIVKSLSEIELCFKVDVITNGSSKISLYKEIINVNKVNLYFSYHHEYAKYNNFVNKYKDIKAENTSIILNVPLTLLDTKDAIKYLDSVMCDVVFNKLDSNKHFTAAYDMSIFDEIKFPNTEKFDCVIDGKKTTIYDYEIFQNNNANFFGFACSTKAHAISVYGEITSDREKLVLPLILSKWDFNRIIICPVQRCICGDGFKYKKCKNEMIFE